MRCEEDVFSPVYYIYNSISQPREWLKRDDEVQRSVPIFT